MQGDYGAEELMERGCLISQGVEGGVGEKGRQAMRNEDIRRQCFIFIDSYVDWNCSIYYCC